MRTSGPKDDLTIRVGDRFEITHRMHFGLGKRYTCTAVIEPKIAGNPDAQPLELGRMICFEAKFDGKVVRHGLPEAWCRKVTQAAQLAKR